MDLKMREGIGMAVGGESTVEMGFEINWFVGREKKTAKQSLKSHRCALNPQVTVSEGLANRCALDHT